jgi:hypothetical protein
VLFSPYEFLVTGETLNCEFLGGKKLARCLEVADCIFRCSDQYGWSNNIRRTFPVVHSSGCPAVQKSHMTLFGRRLKRGRRDCWGFQGHKFCSLRIGVVPGRAYIARSPMHHPSFRHFDFPQLYTLSNHYINQIN